MPELRSEIPFVQAFISKVSTRFLTQTDRSGECWLWTGYVAPATLRQHGYPHTKIGGNRQAVHRVAYQLFVGRIPDGMNVNHVCDNHLCVKPEHLWLGTQRENVHDAMLKGRLRGGQHPKSECQRGHYRTPENLTKRGQCRECVRILQRERNARLRG